VSREVRLARPEDLPAVYALRHEVFVLGQDVPEDMERDEHDEVVDHGVALLDGVVLATGRLLPPTEPGGAATVGRMAVAEAARGLGFGAAVLDLLEQTARDRGWPAVELHAQIHATGFYDRAGYVPYGDVYLEAGIEHLSMRKDL
jgi:predicted GNAT family N-acyltransferase